MGTEARGVVIPERRDEPEKRGLRIRECGWSRDPHTGAAAGLVALKFRIVAMISNARREHGTTAVTGACAVSCPFWPLVVSSATRMLKKNVRLIVFVLIR